MSSIAEAVSSEKPVLAASLPLFILDLLAGVRAGFPSPAEDLGAKRIDLTAKLIKHPQATFLLRARGDSMKEAGIFDGDVLVVDRAIPPRSGHVVIAIVEGEFVCKSLWMRAGRMKLKAANPCYPDIVPRDGQSVEVWGVVLHAIKSLQA
jgi:DNA polymerase V